jgi:predicted transcriptional regulator
MDMDFKKAKILSNYLSRDYAETVFRFLVNYKNVSASEIASRLNMHIRPIQEFLETMTLYDIVEKEEVYEKKRPYYRYSIKKKKIEIIINLEEIFNNEEEQESDFRIRELKNSHAKFTVARNGEYFSTITIWNDKKRDSKEHRINLTKSQGKFLYYLPFPKAEPISVDNLMKKANIDNMTKQEIFDIINVLYVNKIIEKLN